MITGIVTALFLMGDLDSPLLVAGAVSVVFATAWARVVTGHHTVLQVSLGVAVSVLAVALAHGIRLMC